MSNSQKDTEPSVYLRFHVTQNKYDSFMKMFQKVSGLSPIESLAGLSKDAGDFHMVFKILVKDTADLYVFAKSLQTIFLKLYDFYPALSEKPSEMHESIAHQFAMAAKKSKLQHANHMMKHLTNV